ncbi:molybdate ABC transporter substrate-binding protein [Sporosarcina sp. G11-34]|uniref:molybdate ABC transporter substrate-binding protein n=1 Tax=Sporosarcina sp. G11-34 TaxID=2849605 RepID=UPI0022A94C1C|nr:molybdate ABC transporter substrate-binding protein [Sporosarcina sp. G11-34]MCZ2259434.1 molybdate ABC transporter substrate-binding protein [Sporosarcina sp. G11-34]
MKKLIFFSLLLVMSLVLIGCTAKKDETSKPKPEEKVVLMVSAAVSLTDALEEIKELYEKDHAVELTYNLQGSGSLAQQIQQGAPVDVFISANQEWMDTLENEELIISATRQDITGNKLVLITGTSSNINYSSVDDISPEDIEQIAIGNPESVPAGEYAEQVLKKLNKLEGLEDRLVLAKDVRQVLTYVETGNVDVGFVYESDALSSDKIQIIATAEDGTHDPVIYPGAVLLDTKHEKEATDFLTFMASEQAQTILQKHGFRK